MTREEAIEAIKEAYGNSEYTDEIIKALEQEPKIGHWIKTELPARDAHECSECGGLALVGEYGNEQLTDFCPHCGADMRGEE